MRVFKVADGTSWVARPHDGEDLPARPHAGWQAVLFEAGPHTMAQRLVYRPTGWLSSATVEELAEALAEGVSVRVRWGD
jgi:hypothetical protein